MGELFREFVVAKRAAEDDAERDLALAWQVASLAARALVGKLPDLKTLLDGARVSRRSERSLSDLRRQVVGILGAPQPASPETVAALRVVKRGDG